MKAVHVLLCLALAHGIGASIFKHKDRQTDDLDFEQLKHINIIQRKHKNQPSNNEWHQNHQHHQLPGLMHSHQQEQKRDQERDQPGPSYREGLEKTQNSQEQQYRHYENYEQPSYQMKHHSSSAQQLEEQVRKQYSSYKQLQNSQLNQQNHRRSISSSSEGSQSSQESQEWGQYNDNVKPNLNDEIYRWIPQDPASSLENQNIAKHDVIERKVHMGVSSSISVQDKEELEKIFSDAQKAMKQLSDDEKMQFHQSLEHAKLQHNEDAEANATQLVRKNRYLVEEHIVKTDDGYILTLFRIPSNIQPRDLKKRPVVFLMHSIDGSADDWLLMGPKKSLPYLLSDAGYDVWLGNARGNKYCKKHVSKHSAVSDFWQYSIDEIALHDLPAMIDYALETTKQEKLFYIGHSQGSTAFFALTATRPEYNDKIIMMYALSPIVYMNNTRSPLFRMMSPSSHFYNRLKQQLGSGPFTPNKKLIRAVGGAMLEAQTGCKDVSSNINFVMAGVNLHVSDAQLMSVVMRHLPAGTSSKVIKQYGQAVASQEFRRYDYGPKINVNVYGKEQPPKYEMENVKVPVSLYYSEDDWLAHPKDVERLEKELPNVKETHKVSEEHFGNMDFQFSTNAPEMVYKSLIESMQKIEEHVSTTIV
ncbi:unnamed protein product [Arctia plantaginis]|uniref:Partial AB-hydrolase lipase domain-containing protein n=1 Tax=Arctia plantaginis TaxID=874455 RepID=A0A8S1BDZ8_ARCPL|nr:unnamed protein product [Arctia plantaginis]